MSSRHPRVLSCDATSSISSVDASCYGHRGGGGGARKKNSEKEIELTMLTEWCIEQLAMLTLGTTGAIGYFGLRGDGKADKTVPPIQASSGDEEKFIRLVCSLHRRRCPFTPRLISLRLPLKSSGGEDKGESDGSCLERSLTLAPTGTSWRRLRPRKRRRLSTKPSAGVSRWAGVLILLYCTGWVVKS
jgi:hypothetical protein